MITATKNGVTRNFTETQWKMMPKDKYGWVSIAAGVPTKTIPIPAELIQKKMVGGATAKNAEIPEEIITKIKKNVGTKKQKDQ